MEDRLIEEELPTPKARLITPPLEPLGVSELEAYVAELQHETMRAQHEIARKQGHRDAADSIFRRTEPKVE